MRLSAAHGPRGRIATTRRQASETLVGTVVFTFLWAFLLNLGLEVADNSGNFVYLMYYAVYTYFPVFLVNTTILWAVLLLLVALTGRLWLSCALMLIPVLIIAGVNAAKIRLRHEPLYVTDLEFLDSPGFLFRMVEPWQLVLGGLAVATAAGAVLWLGRFPRRVFHPISRRALPRWWWATVAMRAVVAVACVMVLLEGRGFNEDGNRLRQVYDHAGADWAWWYQVLNYRRNGMIGGLLYNQFSTAMARPDGYSREGMRRITAKWQAIAEEQSAATVNSIEDINIVVVLSEAFSDPTDVEPAKLQDPIPFTRSLMGRTTSGTMLAQIFGGGTANMEFEVITSQSLALLQPQVVSPYQQFVSDQVSYPSIVGYLKQHGHRAIAIHPYVTAMYQRPDVYRAFGIGEFVHDTTMQETETIDSSEFISDESAFQELRWQLRQSEKPIFVNLVTMQNHYPMANVYDDPWPVSQVTGSTKAGLAGYARGLNHSDNALKRLLSDLAESEEKTAVVFYGDHLPAFWSDEIYQRNGEQKMRSTPFFVWTNFPTPKLDTAPLTSPVFFMPLLFEQLGVQQPPFYALLNALYREVPALAQRWIFDSVGNLTQDQDLSRTARELLQEYRMVQYDLSIGERHSLEGMYYGH